MTLDINTIGNILGALILFAYGIHLINGKVKLRQELHQALQQAQEWETKARDFYMRELDLWGDLQSMELTLMDAAREITELQGKLKISEDVRNDAAGAA